MQDLTSRRRLLPPSSPAILVPSGAIIVVYIVCRTTSRVPIDPLSRRHSPLNIDTLTLRDSISSPSSYLVACCTNNHFLGRTVSFDSKRFYSRHPKDMIPQKTTTVHASPTRHDQVRQKIMLYQNPPPLLLLNPPPPHPRLLLGLPRWTKCSTLASCLNQQYHELASSYQPQWALHPRITTAEASERRASFDSLPLGRPDPGEGQSHGIKHLDNPLHPG